MDEQTAELIRYANAARESGLWPVSGGALDQTSAFLEAEAVVRAEVARHQVRRAGV